MRVEILTKSGAVIHYDPTIEAQRTGVEAAIEALGGIAARTELHPGFAEPTA